jgi:hypothetical protein
LGRDENTVQNKPEGVPRSGARFTVNLRVKVFPSVETEERVRHEKSFEGELQNLSSGGACVITGQPLRAFEVLKITFPISNIVSTPGTLAEVRWSNVLPEGKYMSGLRFLL